MKGKDKIVLREHPENFFTFLDTTTDTAVGIVYFTHLNGGKSYAVQVPPDAKKEYFSNLRDALHRAETEVARG